MIIHEANNDNTESGRILTLFLFLIWLAIFCGIFLLVWIREHR